MPAVFWDRSILARPCCRGYSAFCFSPGRCTSSSTIWRRANGASASWPRWGLWCRWGSSPSLRIVLLSGIGLQAPPEAAQKQNAQRGHQRDHHHPDGSRQADIAVIKKSEDCSQGNQHSQDVKKPHKPLTVLVGRICRFSSAAKTKPPRPIFQVTRCPTVTHLYLISGSPEHSMY